MNFSILIKSGYPETHWYLCLNGKPVKKLSRSDFGRRIDEGKETNWINYNGLRIYYNRNRKVTLVETA